MAVQSPVSGKLPVDYGDRRCTQRTLRWVNLKRKRMNLTIDLSEENAAALEAQARAARMSAERYLAIFRKGIASLPTSNRRAARSR